MTATLSRIIIFGQAIEQLKDFYVDNFDLPVVEEFKDEWVVLRAGAAEIALHKAGNVGESTFRAQNNTKLVFIVYTDLNLVRQQLIDRGVSIRDVRSFPGISSLFCDGEDPEGNVFQLEQRIE